MFKTTKAIFIKVFLIVVVVVFFLSQSIHCNVITKDEKCRTIGGVTYNPFAYDASHICLSKEQVIFFLIYYNV